MAAQFQPFDPFLSKKTEEKKSLCLVYTATTTSTQIHRGMACFYEHPDALSDEKENCLFLLSSL